MKTYQIALDGPAGAGKSTIARRTAEQLGFVYIDTGAMYRAMGLFLLGEGIDLNSEEMISARCADANIVISHVEGQQHVFLDGEDVSERIRTEEAGMAASRTSAYPAVRRKLVQLQQEMAKVQSVVMDGRDIGTKVLPDATLKIYMTADAGVRAERRYRELIAKGKDAEYDTILKDIEQRDYQDMNRKESPLCQAEDAILLDTSAMSIEEVCSSILSLFEERK